ncbi:hypothetical protein [Egicoccus halophilus]|uniref:hypothetical protein n=1 Tax=Egicoccus halophilus TaxID=1670830 RepID=UPI0010303412|nr:hypothetical protein [Egicoccus halophilus]
MERRLVFVSAGDRHRLDPSLVSGNGFDVLIYFYGDDRGVQNDLARRGQLVERKGGKWPNLLAAHRSNVANLGSYDAVLVLDDDLALTNIEVLRLFDVREHYNLCIAQPAFDRRGRVSYAISTPSPWTSLRYVELVEVNAPLFAAEQLITFLDVYDGSLTGWGVDWWYTEVLCSGARMFAVVDEVVCINPLDREGQREIERLQSKAQRIADWERVREQHGLQQLRAPRTVGRVWRRPDRALVAFLVEAGRVVALLRAGGEPRRLQLKRWRMGSKRCIRGVVVRLPVGPN